MRSYLEAPAAAEHRDIAGLFWDYCVLRARTDDRVPLCALPSLASSVCACALSGLVPPCLCPACPPLSLCAGPLWPCASVPVPSLISCLRLALA